MNIDLSVRDHFARYTTSIVALLSSGTPLCDSFRRIQREVICDAHPALD